MLHARASDNNKTIAPGDGDMHVCACNLFDTDTASQGATHLL